MVEKKYPRPKTLSESVAVHMVDITLKPESFNKRNNKPDKSVYVFDIFGRLPSSLTYSDKHTINIHLEERMQKARFIRKINAFVEYSPTNDQNVKKLRRQDITYRHFTNRNVLSIGFKIPDFLLLENNLVHIHITLLQDIEEENKIKGGSEDRRIATNILERTITATEEDYITRNYGQYIPTQEQIDAFTGSSTVQTLAGLLPLGAQVKSDDILRFFKKPDRIEEYHFDACKKLFDLDFARLDNDSSGSFLGALSKILSPEGTTTIKGLIANVIDTLFRIKIDGLEALTKIEDESFSFGVSGKIILAQYIYEILLDSPSDECLSLTPSRTFLESISNTIPRSVFDLKSDKMSLKISEYIDAIDEIEKNTDQNELQRDLTRLALSLRFNVTVPESLLNILRSNNVLPELVWPTNVSRPSLDAKRKTARTLGIALQKFDLSGYDQNTKLKDLVFTKEEYNGFDKDFLIPTMFFPIRLYLKIKNNNESDASELLENLDINTYSQLQRKILEKYLKYLVEMFLSMQQDTNLSDRDILSNILIEYVQLSGQVPVIDILETYIDAALSSTQSSLTDTNAIGQVLTFLITQIEDNYPYHILDFTVGSFIQAVENYRQETNMILYGYPNEDPFATFQELDEDFKPPLLLGFLGTLVTAILVFRGVFTILREQFNPTPMLGI